MDPSKSDEPQLQLLNVSQKKRNRNKSNNQVIKTEVEITPEEIPIEDAMKGLSLAPHQVDNIFHFFSPLIIFMNV